MNDDRIIDRAFAATSPFGTGSEQTFSGALSLFRRRYAKDPAGADVAVLGVPYDLAVTNVAKAFVIASADMDAATNTETGIKQMVESSHL